MHASSRAYSKSACARRGTPAPPKIISTACSRVLTPRPPLSLEAEAERPLRATKEQGDERRLTRVVHEIMVVHDLRPVPEHGLERLPSAPLALRAARPHLLLLPGVQQRVRVRVRDVPQADAAQEVREAPVVPELLLSAGARAVPGGVPRVLLEFGKELVDERQHARVHDAARRVRDAEEEVRQLERRQRQAPALLFELARFARDKFLRFRVHAWQASSPR